MQTFGSRVAGDTARNTIGRSGDLLPPETRAAHPRRATLRRAADIVDAEFETLPARAAPSAVMPVYPVFNDNRKNGPRQPRVAASRGRSGTLAAIEAVLRAMPASVFAFAVVALVTGSFYASAGLLGNSASSGVAAPATLSVTTLRSDASGTTLLTVSGDREITQRHTPPPTLTVDVIAGGKTVSTTRVLAE